jgi:hypothetical protein
MRPIILSAFAATALSMLALSAQAQQPSYTDRIDLCQHEKSYLIDCNIGHTMMNTTKVPDTRAYAIPTVSAKKPFRSNMQRGEVCPGDGTLDCQR